MLSVCLHLYTLLAPLSLLYATRVILSQYCIYVLTLFGHLYIILIKFSYKFFLSCFICLDPSQIMEPSRQYICAYKLSLVCASCTSESVAQDPKSFRTPRMCKPCYNLKASKAYNSRRTSRLSRNTQPTLVSFRPSLLVETQLLKQVNKSLIFAIKKKDDKIKEITAQLSAAQAD